MLDSKTLMQIVNSQLNVGNATLANDSITTGVVVDGDDPLQNGRLRIFCPNLNDDPKKLHHIPWAVGSSPLAGTISNSGFSRGAGKGAEKTSGPVSYGFWGTPEQGAIVLVAKIDGDERRRVWLGCIQSHQETHTLLHGRYKWNGDGGTPDGPLSSTGDPIQPQYENAAKAFNDKKDSAEWKTRQAEYQATAIPKSGGIHTKDGTAALDEQYGEIAEAEEDDWVKGILGAHGYDWSANKNLGAFLQSKVYGWSTPGFHAFAMDDRPYSNRIRIRSATGHQLIFDDTNERIYLSTNEGNNFLEFDSNGNIDIYSKKRISISAEDDINFSTDKTFRVKAKEGIYMYSGDTVGQDELEDEKPGTGEIRFHSTGDTHFMIEKNLRVLVKESKLTEIGENSYLSVGEKMFTQVEGDVNMIVNDGNHNTSVKGDTNTNTTGSISGFAGDDISMQASNDMKLFAYTGLMDIGSQLDLTVKSYTSTVTVEALTDDLKLSANAGTNQIEANKAGISIFSLMPVNTRSGTELNNQCYINFDIDENNVPTADGNPLGGDCIRIPGAVNIKFDSTAIKMDAVEDVAFKIAEGISTVTDKTDLSVKKINESLEVVEEKVNLLSSTAYSYIDDLVTFLGAPSGLPDFPWTPTIPIPQLPSLDFSAVFPSIELPDFDFDFCLEMGDIISIPKFDILPDGGFININTNLGGWSKETITDWFERESSEFDNMVDSFNVASQISNSFDTAIDQVKLDLLDTRNALDNLVNVNVTNNVSNYNDYSTATTALSLSIGNYSILVAGEPTVPSVVPLQNELENQSRAIKAINDLVQNEPSYNTQAFSELQPAVDTLDDVLNRLIGVGT